jgi:hypothetical protein
VTSQVRDDRLRDDGVGNEDLLTDEGLADSGSQTQSVDLDPAISDGDHVAGSDRLLHMEHHSRKNVLDDVLDREAGRQR